MTPSEFKAARIRLGLDQSQLAAMMGYNHQSCISRLETGKSHSPQAFRLMAAYVAGYMPESDAK